MDKSEILRKIAAIKAETIKLNGILEDKDVQILPGEKLNDLVTDVENLPTYSRYADEGVIELITDNDTLIINSMSDKPYELCLVNDELITHEITSLESGFLVPELSISINYSEFTPQTVNETGGVTKTIYFTGYISAETPSGSTVDECLKVTVYSRSNETGYSVELSYAEYNEDHPSATIVFTGGYPYIWLAVYHNIFEVV